MHTPEGDPLEIQPGATGGTLAKPGPMTRTSAIAASLLLAMPVAASAVEDEDLRDEASQRPELTVSGTAETQAFLLLPGLTFTFVKGPQVFEINGGFLPHPADGIFDVATSLLAG